MNDVYVYTLAYPESMGGQVFYIGKGSGYRINQHENEARLGKQSKKCEIIRSILNAGERVVKCKVHEGLSSHQAYEQERLLIQQYGLENLANSKDGGLIGRIRRGDYERISLDVRRDLLAKIAASGQSRREVIERLLEQL